MKSSEDPAIQSSDHSPRATKASSVLGVISIIFALIALSLTIFNSYYYQIDFLLIILMAAPLMISSLVMSTVGLFLSSKRLIGRKISSIGLILTFSPIAVVLTPYLMSSIEEWIQDNRHKTFVNGVNFNKEKTVLIHYPKNKTETNYTIPVDVTSIGHSAFSDCINLASITIPDSVTSIGNSAFNGCTNLTSITIPDSVTSISEAAFMNCANLTSITIPNSVTSIGSWTFSECTSLERVIIPDGVTSIGGGTFSGCNNLTSITIPNGVTSIGIFAFDRCSSLKSVTIPSSVTIIGQSAFDRCSSLKSLTIPDSVTIIRDAAFFNCKSLTTVTFHGDAPKVGNDVFLDATPTIYRKPEAKGWGDIFGGRPVKLISEKP